MESKIILGIRAIYTAIYFFIRSVFNKRIHTGRWNMCSLSSRIITRKKGIIQLGCKNRIGMHVTLSASGLLDIGDGCDIKPYTDIQANKGTLEIGNHVFINSNCLLVSCESIKIGDGTSLGSGVYIYDHDHIFSTKGHQNWNNNVTSPVIIGKNCWIGAHTVILRGSIIGDNSVIGAGCVLKGTVPSGTIVTQKRTTVLRQLND